MKPFTDDEIGLLLCNDYVQSVSRTKIRYTEEFKNFFIEEYKAGRKPTDIFREAGFDIEMIGAKRVERSAARFRQRYGVEVIK